MNFKEEEQIQNLRNKIKFSTLTCEKVLNNFSNLNFVEKTLQSCEQECYDKYNKIYSDEDNSKNYQNIKTNFIECTDKCEQIYKRIIDHQVKGAEISYVLNIFIFSLLIKNI
jgi:predicted transcriptional regulator